MPRVSEVGTVCGKGIVRRLGYEGGGGTCEEEEVEEEKEKKDRKMEWNGNEKKKKKRKRKRKMERRKERVENGIVGERVKKKKGKEG